MLNLVSLSTQSLASYVNYFCLGLFTVFFQHEYRFRYKFFRYCSIFKVLCAAALAADDLIILPQKRFFVKHFFEKLLKFCELGTLSVSRYQPWACRGDTPPSCFRKTALFAWTPHRGDSLLSQPQNFWTFIGSFQGLPAEASEVILLSQRLALKYNTTPRGTCQHFLTSFLK